MKGLKFPIDFTFKITTLSNDFIAKDTDENVVVYVKQKKFKFKESVEVFQDTSKQTLSYKIKADKWIDFSAAYSISNATGNFVGKVARKGMASIWKAEYDIIDQFEQSQFKIKEENAWVKVMDFLLGQVPIIGLFTGYLFNPVYLVTNNSGKIVVKLKKESSLVDHRFKVSKEGNIDDDDVERIILSLMMMVLLERGRG
ncbi:MAG: hypothetical protein KAT32_03490 [Candidatus Moranbacteria bacterium]|nr:hypothetical protein [Candidatus Moranbacteria bacterium]